MHIIVQRVQDAVDHLLVSEFSAVVLHDGVNDLKWLSREGIHLRAQKVCDTFNGRAHDIGRLSHNVEKTLCYFVVGVVVFVRV
jgi:hypothetical protein